MVAMCIMHLSTAWRTPRDDQSLSTTLLSINEQWHTQQSLFHITKHLKVISSLSHTGMQLKGCHRQIVPPCVGFAHPKYLAARFHDLFLKLWIFFEFSKWQIPWIFHDILLFQLQFFFHDYLNHEWKSLLQGRLKHFWGISHQTHNFQNNCFPTLLLHNLYMARTPNQTKNDVQKTNL